MSTKSKTCRRLRLESYVELLVAAESTLATRANQDICAIMNIIMICTVRYSVSTYFLKTDE